VVACGATASRQRVESLQPPSTLLTLISSVDGNFSCVLAFAPPDWTALQLRYGHVQPTEAGADATAAMQPAFTAGVPHAVYTLQLPYLAATLQLNATFGSVAPGSALSVSVTSGGPSNNVALALVAGV